MEQRKRGRESREGSGEGEQGGGGEERAGRGVGRESRMHDVASPDGGGRAVRVAGWIIAIGSRTLAARMDHSKAVTSARLGSRVGLSC